MSIKARVAAVVAGLVLAGLSAAQTPRLEIPYRTRAIQVDGDLKEWAGQGLVAVFEDPDPRGNRVTARLAWDRQALYAAFDVVDPTVFPPPPNTRGTHLYQWDSVELYVGPGRSGTVIGSQDLQLILAADGRVGALRGDDFLASAGWQVPKREVTSVAVLTAARPTSSGYAVECAVPWTVLGMDPPAAGSVLRIDLANNNWLENHPPLPEVVMDFDNVLELMDRGPEKRGEIRLDDPQGMGWAAGRAIVERAYLPWSWGGAREFGFPENWHTVVLVGGPGWRERLAGALGFRGAVLVTSLAVAGLAGCALVLLSRRDRRRREALLGRLREMEEELAAGPETAALPSTSSGPPPKEPPASPPPRVAGGVHYDPLTTTIDRVESLVRRGDPVPRELCSQAIAYIVQHLHRSMAPQEVAAGVHVSLRTLQRAVSTSLGCTPGELITAVRMREAQRLLTREGLLVKDVALRLGFASVSHFSRIFKHFFQVPPSEVGSGQQPTFGPHN